MKVVRRSEAEEKGPETAGKPGEFPRRSSKLGGLGSAMHSRRECRNARLLKRAFRSREWVVLSEDPRFQEAMLRMRTIDEAEEVIKIGLILLDEKVWWCEVAGQEEA
jgi:hypothetical protein